MKVPSITAIGKDQVIRRLMAIKLDWFRSHITHQKQEDFLIHLDRAVIVYQCRRCNEVLIFRYGKGV